MDNLHHELLVLSKAVNYKNISTAATNIGLSQPQISRIIARLESNLEVKLLDRGSKRNATWTEPAHRLAEIYKRRMRSLNSEIQQIVGDQMPRFLQVACLEGLLYYASAMCHELLQQTPLEGIELNVYDLSVLEERFVKHKLDLTITSREPGKKKYIHNKLLGFQSLEKQGQSKGFEVLSTFEHNLVSARMYKKTNSQRKYLISNSLSVRRQWIEEFGGEGIIPSQLTREKLNHGQQTPVFLLAQDDIHPQIWEFAKKSVNDH